MDRGSGLSKKDRKGEGELSTSMHFSLSLHSEHYEPVPHNPIAMSSLP